MLTLIVLIGELKDDFDLFHIVLDVYLVQNLNAKLEFSVYHNIRGLL
jgi:hypothetical protein